MLSYAMRKKKKNLPESVFQKFTIVSQYCIVVASFSFLFFCVGTIVNRFGALGISHPLYEH